MRLAAGIFVACALSLAGCAGTGITFPNMERNDIKTAQGTLVVPEGRGPYPAVVIMHGCSGVRPNAHMWASWLKEHGYASLVVETFPLRNLAEICSNLGRVPISARALDAYAGLRYLASRPDVAADRIAVMGFSNGAVASLNVASDTWQNELVSGTKLRFRAAIALYPECKYQPRTYGIPTAILIGDKDDWTLSASCESLAKELGAGSRPIELRFYPGGHHAFDDLTSGAYLAHVMNGNGPTGRGANVWGDASILGRAKVDVLDFLKRHLAPR